MTRVWRDYLILAVEPDGTQRVLESCHVKVGTAFEYALDRHADVFKAGRGRIVLDETPGADARLRRVGLMTGNEFLAGHSAPGSSPRAPESG